MPASSLREKPVTPIAALMQKHFPGERRSIKILNQAGKKLKNQGEVAAIKYLRDHTQNSDGRVPSRTGSLDVLAISRPYQEWDMVRLWIKIQTAVYKLTRDEVLHLKKQPQDAEGRAKVFDCLRIRGPLRRLADRTAQWQNAFLEGAINTYLGVEKKAGNRDKKAKDKAARLHRSAPEPTPVYTARGKLIHPPGINPTLYCPQQCRYQILDRQTADRLGILNVETREVDEAFPRAVDRLLIPRGQPGYVPEHDRSSIRAAKRRGRNRGRVPVRGGKPIPSVITVPACDGIDYVVHDDRDKLRLARRRKIPVSTPGELRALFTGDPVLSQRDDGIVLRAAMLLPEHAGFRQRKPVKSKTDKALLEACESGDVALVSVDLGVTNPVAYQIDAINSHRGRLSRFETVRGQELTAKMVGEINGLLEAKSSLTNMFRAQARILLPRKLQSEVDMTYKEPAAVARKALVARYGKLVSSVPWETMGGRTCHISDLLRAAGVDESEFTFRAKKKRITKTDYKWAMELKPRLRDETRKAYNDAQWELQRTSPEYQRHTVRQRQVVRTIVNQIVRHAERLRCGTVAIAIEDLNVRFFSGRGRREEGWDSFFTPKTANKWLIQALHRAFSDLAPNRGMLILEVCPARTSQACPFCGCVSAENRSDLEDREAFACVECGREAHADLIVAPHNIGTVALTGRPIAKLKETAYLIQDVYDRAAE